MRVLVLAVVAVAVVSAYGPPKSATNPFIDTGCSSGNCGSSGSSGSSDGCGSSGCAPESSTQKITCSGSGCSSGSSSGGGGCSGAGCPASNSGPYWWQGTNSPFKLPPGTQGSRTPTRPFQQTLVPKPSPIQIALQNLVIPPMGICGLHLVCLHWQLCRDGYVISDGTGVINKQLKIPPQVKSKYTSCGGDMVCCGVPSGSSVSSGGSQVPSGSFPVPSGGSLVPSGSFPVPSGSSLVPSGSFPVPSGGSLVPSGSFPVPSGGSLVPSGSFPVPSGGSLVPSGSFPVPSGGSLVPSGSFPVPSGGSLVPSGSSLHSGSVSVHSGSLPVPSGGSLVPFGGSSVHSDSSSVHSGGSLVPFGGSSVHSDSSSVHSGSSSVPSGGSLVPFSGSSVHSDSSSVHSGSSSVHSGSSSVPSDGSLVPFSGSSVHSDSSSVHSGSSSVHSGSSSVHSGSSSVTSGSSEHSFDLPVPSSGSPVPSAGIPVPSTDYLVPSADSPVPSAGTQSAALLPGPPPSSLSLPTVSQPLKPLPLSQLGVNPPTSSGSPAQNLPFSQSSSRVHQTFPTGGQFSGLGPQPSSISQAAAVAPSHSPSAGHPGSQGPPLSNPMMGMMGMMPMRSGSCSAGTYCVPAQQCNPYTGFILRDNSMVMAVWPDSPTVPLLPCFVPDGSITGGVCCQEPHPNAGGAD